MRSQKAPEIRRKVTFVWDFHFSVDGSHLVNSLDFRRKTSMNAENFVFDECSQWKIIKGLIEVLPRGRASIFFHDLIIKPVDSGNLPGLMISPEQDDIFGILKLVTEKEFNSLNRIVPSVNKIANKNIPGPWQFASDLKQLKDIIKLSMNVTTNDNWSFSLMHIGFFEEELLNFVAESTHASFVQAFALFESCDPLVDFGHMYFKFFIVFESVIN